jgi:hypothetical protein
MLEKQKQKDVAIAAVKQISKLCREQINNPYFDVWRNDYSITKTKHGNNK